MGHTTTPRHLQVFLEYIAEQHSPPVLPSCKTSDAKSEDADADSTHLRSHTKRNWMTNDHQIKTWRSQQVFSLETWHTPDKKQTLTLVLHTPVCFFLGWSLPNLQVSGAYRIGLMLSLHWHPQKTNISSSQKKLVIVWGTLHALWQPKRPFATAGLFWALHIGVFSPFSLACLSSSLRWKVFFFTQSSPKSSRYQLSMPVSKSICTCPILTSHSTCVHWLLSSP